MTNKSHIYLDNASTTQTDREIAELIVTILTEGYGNPSSLHTLGLEAGGRIKKATDQIKKALGIKSGKIYYTSGGTEANNTAIFGAAASLARRGKTIVTTAMEHSSVQDSFKKLAEEGFLLKIVAPRNDGITYAEDIIEACDNDTILVSAILVNNETGAMLDAEAMIKGVRRASPNAIIHLDGVQAVGKHPINLSKIGADLFTFSGHKIYGPKGIGALYIREGVRIKPLLYGGAQQDKIRPGTENVAYIAALGQATENAVKNLEEQIKNIEALCSYLRERLAALPYVLLNSPIVSSPYITNISVEGLRSETVLHLMEEDGIYLSSGSACAKGAASHVLTALGLSRDRVDSAIRISLGKHNTKEDIDLLIKGLEKAKERLISKRRP